MASRLRQTNHNNFPARRTTSVGAFEAVEDVTVCQQVQAGWGLIDAWRG